MSIPTKNMDPQLYKTSKIIKIGPIALENGPNEIGGKSEKKDFFRIYDPRGRSYFKDFTENLDF